MEKPIDFQNVQELSIALTRMASVTDSPGEKAFPTFLLSMLGQIPYFRNNPDNLAAMAIPDDPKERSNVFALVKGSGTRCVILTGHYDVVQTSMYGSLEPWAFDPEILHRKMLESLAAVTGKDNPLSRLKGGPRLGRIPSRQGHPRYERRPRGRNFRACLVLHPL